jgi:hypothetical protein
MLGLDPSAKRRGAQYNGRKQQGNQPRVPLRQAPASGMGRALTQFAELKIRWPARTGVIA